jgi:penicillin-binding protein 2
VQLARTIGGIALGGVFEEPHLLMTSKPTQEQRFPLSEDTTEKVTQAMFGVVNEGGTAAGVHLEGIELCGKTGSAQVISAEGLKRAGKQKRFSDNAWFVGYAPRRHPEIVVAVLVEGGEHGASAAAPVARDVIKAYYDKKTKRNQQQYTVEYKRYDFGSEPLVSAGQPALPAGASAAAEAEPRTNATKLQDPVARPQGLVRQELRSARSHP